MQNLSKSNFIASLLDADNKGNNFIYQSILLCYQNYHNYTYHILLQLLLTFEMQDYIF